LHRRHGHGTPGALVKTGILVFSIGEASASTESFTSRPMAAKDTVPCFVIEFLCRQRNWNKYEQPKQRVPSDLLKKQLHGKPMVSLAKLSSLMNRTKVQWL
jgi:hypothetical protein